MTLLAIAADVVVVSRRLLFLAELLFLIEQDKFTRLLFPLFLTELLFLTEPTSLQSLPFLLRTDTRPRTVSVFAVAVPNCMNVDATSSSPQEPATVLETRLTALVPVAATPRYWSVAATRSSPLELATVLATRLTALVTAAGPPRY